MKILALADEPCKALWDYCSREKLAGIDLVLSCGDLPAAYLEYITNFTAAPILYVPGNHDGSADVHHGLYAPGGCFSVDDSVYVYRGLRIAGLGGCLRYDPHAVFQYSESTMRYRAAKLRFHIRRAGGLDLLLTHAPARGIHDGEDAAHRGFEAFTGLLREHRPAYFVHGHVHLNYSPNQPRISRFEEATTVINAFERYTFEIPDVPCEKWGRQGYR